LTSPFTGSTLIKMLPARPSTRGRRQVHKKSTSAHFESSLGGEGGMPHHPVCSCLERCGAPTRDARVWQHSVRRGACRRSMLSRGAHSSGERSILSGLEAHLEAGTHGPTPSLRPPAPCTARHARPDTPRSESRWQRRLRRAAPAARQPRACKAEQRARPQPAGHHVARNRAQDGREDNGRADQEGALRYGGQLQAIHLRAHNAHAR